MDLKINSIGFQGKQQVLNRLNSASKYAKEAASKSNKPAYFDQFMEAEAAMYAYLDMAVEDKCFFSIPKRLKQEDYAIILKNLTPSEKDKNSNISAATYFTDALARTLKNSSSSIKNAGEEICAKIKELLG